MPYKPTKEQKKIINHDHSKHARVLAGPGTGKSSTVVALMERLLDLEENPRVRLITFTRCATTELAGKIAEITGGEEIHLSTIHSFSIAILLMNGGMGKFPEPLRIADDWENDRIVLPMLARLMDCTKKVAEQHLREMASAWESLDEDLPDSEFQRMNELDFWESGANIGISLDTPY